MFNLHSTMNIYNITAKKKFDILLKLMKNNKFSPTPPLIENKEIINTPQQKCEIFNAFFASKSNRPGSNDDPPYLYLYIIYQNLIILTPLL